MVAQGDVKIEIKAEEMTEERPRKRQRSSSLEQQSNTNGHKTAAPAAAPPPLIPLEPSFFRVSPNDEFTREVGQWILAWSTDRQNVEIEAKLGILLDTRNHHAPVPSRLYFPVATECIITDPSLCHFESNMTVAQHAGYNALLNASVEDSASPSYIGARIKYSHTKEIDYFHSMPNGGKCRVTMNVNKDQTITPKPGGIVEKERIANMNVYSPKQLFDFRISVSTERPVDVPPTSPVKSERFKDRVSYKHQILQVDLTKVESKDPKEHHPVPPSYELEVEVSDMHTLMKEADKERRGEANIYFNMIQVFLNTIRMLIRNAENP